MVHTKNGTYEKRSKSDIGQFKMDPMIWWSISMVHIENRPYRNGTKSDMIHFKMYQIKNGPNQKWIKSKMNQIKNGPNQKWIRSKMVHMKTRLNHMDHFIWSVFDMVHFWNDPFKIRSIYDMIHFVMFHFWYGLVLISGTFSSSWLSWTMDSRSLRFFSRFSFLNQFKITWTHYVFRKEWDSQGENDVRKFLTQKMFYKDPRYLRK